MNEKIIVGIDNEIVELKGDALDSFLADRAAIAEKERLLSVQLDEKAKQKIALLDRLGITADEAKLLLS
jgi:hypothetical protein